MVFCCKYLTRSKREILDIKMTEMYILFLTGYLTDRKDCIRSVVINKNCERLPIILDILYLSVFRIKEDCTHQLRTDNNCHLNLKPRTHNMTSNVI